jgi:hypothetical protein
VKISRLADLTFFSAQFARAPLRPQHCPQHWQSNGVTPRIIPAGSDSLISSEFL